MNSPMSILVIEDEEVQAKLLCRLITTRIPTAICRMAHNLEDGLSTSLSDNHDLTLLDIQIPRSKSDRTVDIDLVVTSIPKMPKPVIVVTQLDDPEGVLMDYCYAYNAENFYSKDYLLKIVETWTEEMKVRQVVSSICSAYMRVEMPKRRHLFSEGVNGLYNGKGIEPVNGR